MEAIHEAVQAGQEFDFIEELVREGDDRLDRALLTYGRRPVLDRGIGVLAARRLVPRIRAGHRISTSADLTRVEYAAQRAQRLELLEKAILNECRTVDEGERLDDDRASMLHAVYTVAETNRRGLALTRRKAAASRDDENPMTGAERVALHNFAQRAWREYEKRR